jgi:hypothetical protein
MRQMERNWEADATAVVIPRVLPIPTMRDIPHA